MTWQSVACIGECMLELVVPHSNELHHGFAGDTYNTAVYLRRVAQELGIDLSVSYLTGLGADPISASMRNAWKIEGIQDRSITISNSKPGIYAVDTSADGERSFTYWRNDTAAQQALRQQDWLTWLNSLEPDVAYLSGITLQLVPGLIAEIVDRLAEWRRQTGGAIAFDTNFRSEGWPDPSVAASAFDAVIGISDYVFAGFEDLAQLGRGGHRVAELEARASSGLIEVILKAGAGGFWVHSAGRVQHYAASAQSAWVVDTAGAGDALAGAYLAARAAGRSPEEAAAVAASAAAVVIGYRGAVAPAGIRLTTT